MIETHQIELEKIKIGMMQHLMGVSADIRESFLTHSAVAFVDPAEAFKQRWFPQWALK